MAVLKTYVLPAAIAIATTIAGLFIYNKYIAKAG